MTRNRWCLVTLLLIYLSSAAISAEKIVIAHRGASAYLPEHTMEAKVLAYGMGADYIEQDVVMTQDDKLVVLHDLTLDRVSNVASLYPDRHREDGHYYVIDFTLAELRQLAITEGFRTDSNGEKQAIYPQRFPVGQGNFRIHTLAEEIELIQGLNKSSGQNIGIYPEIKSPWFHHQEGKDLSLAVLETLKQYGYSRKTDKVYLQSFDANELKRIHDELLPMLNIDLKLVQLIADNSWLETFETDDSGDLKPYDYDWMHTDAGLVELAQYADGIGPSINMIITQSSTSTMLLKTNLVEFAHNHGLDVHPYTFRADDGLIPAYAENFERLLEIFLDEIAVDGVFTDFPDRAVQFLDSRN